MVTRNKTREQKCVTRNKPREQKCVTRNKHREQKMVTRNYFIYIQPIRFELGLIGPIESLWWLGGEVLGYSDYYEHSCFTFGSCSITLLLQPSPLDPGCCYKLFFFKIHCLCFREFQNPHWNWSDFWKSLTPQGFSILTTDYRKSPIVNIHYNIYTIPIYNVINMAYQFSM